jgi:two-component SAPR family response regulator
MDTVVTVLIIVDKEMAQLAGLTNMLTKHSNVARHVEKQIEKFTGC